MENKQPSILAMRLKTAREQAGLSQGQVAKMLNLHRPSISEIEAGRRKVSSDELTQFATIYGISIAWLTATDTDQGNDINPRIELAARELAKLKPDDFERVLNLLMALRNDESPLS